MATSLLEQRVEEGVLGMGEGEETTVGRIATIEGVSKSPQLYAILQQLVDDGYLVREERLHSNRQKMFVFVRSSKQHRHWDPAFEGKGY